ncbi:LysR family transcriptional regulator [Aureimonas populi]|uniref:LysR family transcriptional regulator n=1 Tax=Aureimonas populi TaxID=1701758 RepID=A0ABW5CJ66_9HYPH|nr:LysR family transcriptional regulator [Aureimonas populi]
MNWDDARIFLAVAREGQLLSAARRLGLNHATVGRRLSALEEALGARLFERRPNGCFITAEGETFLASAERIEEEWLAARARLATPGGAVTGTVRIGAPDGFGTAFLAPRLGPLLARHPHLGVELVPVPRAFSLSRREADIAITLERPEHGRLVSRKLVDYSLGLYAATSYLDRRGRPHTLEELAGHDLVGPVDDLLHTPHLAYAADLKLEWRARFAVSSALGQTEATAAGFGIGILHRFLAAPLAGVESVLPQAEVRRSYWLALHESARDVPRIAAVAGFIAELVRAERAIFG